MTVASCNRMDGKICVVTGATQGLGAAIARRLAAAGAAGIVVTGRNGERGAHVAREIAETHGIWAHFLQADFAHVEDCRMVIAETDRLFGRIDVLVNAGASTARGTILDTTPETFDALFQTNVRGPYFLMQEAIRLMIARGIAGAICNIGSISALAGQPFINAYCASKGALTTLTANTAFSVMANRIRVNLGSQGRRRPALRAAGGPGRGGAGGQLPGFRRCRADDRGDRQLRPVGLGRGRGRNARAGRSHEIARSLTCRAHGPVTTGMRGASPVFCNRDASATHRACARHIGAASDREKVYSCSGTANSTCASFA